TGFAHRTARRPPQTAASSPGPQVLAFVSECTATCPSAVRLALTQQRSTSATLHACAMHPRGRNGGSAAKTSLIDPTHASLSSCWKPIKSARTLSGLSPYSFTHASTNGPISHAHTVP